MTASIGGKGIDEIRKAMLDQERELQKFVSVVEGHIVINVDNEYNIALSKCDTHEKILAWIVHLSEKTWMTTTVLKRFIHVASKENGLSIPSV